MTRPTGGPAAIATVDGLLTVQEAPDPRERARRAIRRATQMLDVLDDLKIGLLGGVLPEAQLARLLETVEAHRDEVGDARLADVLDQIELRGRVELAKLGRIAA